MGSNIKRTEVFKSHPVHIPIHKNFDFDSLQELPDSYDWIQPDSFPNSSLSNNHLSDSIPLIDLSLPNAPHLIGNAFRTWGAFQVINHGVPISLLHSIESSANSLFSLPAPHKLKAARPSDGISGYGLVRISSFFPKRMWSEGFTIVGSPLEHFRKLWPHDYTRYWYSDSHPSFIIFFSLNFIWCLIILKFVVI